MRPCLQTQKCSPPITTVITDPAFGQFGRLLFPVDDWYYSGDTLGELQLTWYSHIDPQETVDIVNDLKTRASAGQPVFFDIYTEEEKAADPDKEDTGLYYFPGRQGAPFALCSAGGGFAYVGAMQDSLPHALALSQHGYHAFALIYRPGAQSGCEDLARAISFVFSHAEELGISRYCAIRSADLCLRRGTRRHRELACHAAAHRQSG